MSNLNILVRMRFPFSGIDPDPLNGDSWSCVSELCEDVVRTWNASELYEIPCATKEMEDGTAELLLKSIDYKWELKRTSFTVEFDMFCDVGSRRWSNTLVSSVYFLGAFLGLLVGSFFFDNIGRKKSALIGNIILVPVTFLGYFCHSYILLLFIRFLQGLGGFLISTSVFILVQEILPGHVRNYANCFFQAFWALGYLIAALVGYIITDWNTLFLCASAIVFVCDLSLFFCVESPRYHLIKNNEDAAKKSFKFLFSLTSIKLDFDRLIIADSNKTKERHQSSIQQMKDLYHYPTLFLETALQMFLWFVSAMCYYGFNFGWGSIIPNMYLGYLMSMIGSLMAYVGMVPLIDFIGRRRALIFVYLGAACCYICAIPEFNLDAGGRWSLESIASLVGIVFISASFSGMYLWSGELAPTSHRGFVFGVSSSAARLGSFFGPFIVLNLRSLVPRPVLFGLLAGSVLLCAFFSFLLVETCDQEVAVTGEDVDIRRRRTHQRQSEK